MRVLLWLALLIVSSGYAAAQRPHEVTIPPLPPSALRNLSAPPISTPPPAPAAPVSPQYGGAPAPPAASSGGSGGGGGGGRSPAPAGLYFVMAVCAAAYDASPQCVSKSVGEGTQKLREMYYEAFRRSLQRSVFRAVFPSWMRWKDQIDATYRMEKAGLALAAAQMQADVSTLTPFDWKVEEQRKLNEWWVTANDDVDNGKNWSRDANLNTHDFGSGNALQQLKHINVKGWGSQ